MNPWPIVPVGINENGQPMSPEQVTEPGHGFTFDGLVAREFLGLTLRRGTAGVYQAGFKEPADGGGYHFGVFHDVPPWSVSGDEALYLLDFVSDFEISTTSRGVRCSVWVALPHPQIPEQLYEADSYGEAGKNEFGALEEEQRGRQRAMGFGPPLGLAICRAVYGVSREMNDVMLMLHYANIRKILGIEETS